MDNEMKEMFKRIFIELDKINGKFTQVDSRFDKIDQRLDKVDQRLDNVDARLDKVDARLDKVEKRIDKLDNRMNVLEIKQERTANALEELKLAVILSEKNIRRDILMLKDAGESSPASGNHSRVRWLPEVGEDCPQCLYLFTINLIIA